MAQSKEQKKTEYCDNHPDKEAVVVTDGNGAHSTVRLCENCMPKNWRVEEV